MSKCLDRDEILDRGEHLYSTECLDRVGIWIGVTVLKGENECLERGERLY